MDLEGWGSLEFGLKVIAVNMRIATSQSHPREVGVAKNAFYLDQVWSVRFWSGGVGGLGWEV